jgi:hypothetical protein
LTTAESPGSRAPTASALGRLTAVKRAEASRACARRGRSRACVWRGCTDDRAQGPASCQELEALGTPEALSELKRRRAKRAEKPARKAAA